MAFPVTAHTVAVRVRQAVPSASTAQVSNLLYLCQGHYVASCREPLFENNMRAVPEGVEVEPDPAPARESSLSENQRTMIDEVVARYSLLDQEALATVVRNTQPWIEAHGGGWFIAPEAIRDEFVQDHPE